MTNDELRQHFDDAIKRQTQHFDAKFSELEEKVEPMYDFYTTGRVGGRVLAWLLGILVAVGTLWAIAKGLPR